VKTSFRESFVKDLNKHRRDRPLLFRVQEVILEIEAAEALSNVQQAKRLKGEGPYYRIRVGDYRLGVLLEGEVVTFVRVLHRKEIYRYFP